MTMQFVRLNTAAKLMTAPNTMHFVRRLALLTPQERSRVALAVQQELRRTAESVK